jgi:hypothetical protein
MPMDEAWRIEMIFEPDAEKPGGFCGKPQNAVRLADAKNRGRFECAGRASVLLATGQGFVHPRVKRSSLRWPRPENCGA